MNFSWQHFVSSLTIAFLLYLTFAQQEPLGNTCDDSGGNFSRNSSYETNLNRLLSSFSFSTANNYGFYNFSSGQGSDKVNTIALCRGDVNSGDCISCINNATAELRNLCPNQKVAIIWYDNCMFRYTNRSIFMDYSDAPLWTWSNGNNVTNVEAFNEALTTLLDGLANSAASGTSLRKFAIGNANVTAFQKVYALVQCTPDLTEVECRSCLSQAIGLIPQCCERRQGVKIFGPSCNLRFEDYRFYNPTNATPPTNETTTTTESGNNTTQIVIIVVASIAGGMILIIISVCIFMRRRGRETPKIVESMDEIIGVESLQFDFDTILVATNNFSDANKLGQGGFGAVYKGLLPNGQELAIKRLSRESAQGDLEFKNEVLLVAKLQHRNLVRLLGFCLAGPERLLIYEFVPNTSLDHFIFDLIKRAQLNWKMRYKIIRGIVRGLLYLHEDSRLRIIHRDLKASNILLDAKMVPKIADFGMARLFAQDESEGNTGRIVGTYGYMAPEYTIHGQFSAKSDVFSFGVLLLEIISGQKNNHFCYGEEEENEYILSFAWRNWKEGTALNLVDPKLSDASRNDMMKCIHLALLCVQENVAARPTMASIDYMLNSFSATLPVPSQPAFVTQSDFESDRLSSSATNSLVTESKKSNIELLPVTNNEVTITDLSPR